MGEYYRHICTTRARAARLDLLPERVVSGDPLGCGGWPRGGRRLCRRSRPGRVIVIRSCASPRASATRAPEAAPRQRLRWWAVTLRMSGFGLFLVLGPVELGGRSLAGRIVREFGPGAQLMSRGCRPVALQGGALSTSCRAAGVYAFVVWVWW